MRSILAALLLLLPGAAAAEALRATYEVYALGSTVLELEARFELTRDAYRVETTLRTRGIAALVASGEQLSRVRGGWAGERPQPADFVTEGVWRGRMRRIALDWDGAEPRVLDLVPSEAEERDPVPEAMRRGTVDVLSALAQLARQVAREGHCELTAPVFDGRRRSDFATRTEGREILRPWRGAWQGEALRCGFEGRLVAGFRRDQDRAEAAAPQRGTAWIAPPYAGAPAIPVRLDIPTRWFGTATAVLLRAEAVERRAEFRR
ncbi:DUF3108 domain-containing protein [Falsiroseomonas oryzae]|uniref:DUF3108 domain-containing protein n=1 Tax=Falsiroseomonas oryzae TaxID=2766473 RepID=UPI0022EA8EF4|nr:DUF3108 domain-containing protein [Roseomonas sp. MO-31]